jgi:hypothetical protein
VHGGVEFTQGVIADIERTRQSGEDAINALISGGLERQVGTSLALQNGNGLAAGFSAGVEVGLLGQVEGWQPYLRGGLASLPAAKAPASAVLELDYAFMAPSGPRFNETDLVTVRSRRPGSLGVELGGGVKKALTESLVFRAGIQTQIHPNTLEVTVETNPARTISTPSGAVVFTPPPNTAFTILMSNVSTLASSLNVRLPETVSFKGAGALVLWAIEVGLGFRF